ncbi:MAG: hypothetical protein ACTSO7_00415 [Candidatus Heimdallarchaeota archaeon]
MSIQKENVIPFVTDTQGNLIPIEAELAYVVGVIGDRIKKGGLFKKTKERLTQVSKFYWRLLVDTIQNRIILVDSLGLYGSSASINDLAFPEVEAQRSVIRSASSINAYSESLSEANRILILATKTYPIFDEAFTNSTLDLAKRRISEDMIDQPLILPSFESRINHTVHLTIEEIPKLGDIQSDLEEIARNWLAEINSRINEIERVYAVKIAKGQEDADRNIGNYKEKMDDNLDSNLERANRAIKTELAKFESTTISLTGMVTPIQEHSRKILQDLPSAETPKFESRVNDFLEVSKNQINGMSSKVKTLENDRKNLAKFLNKVTQSLLNGNQGAVDEYENKKNKALNEVDETRMRRDRDLSQLTGIRDNIKNTTSSIISKIEELIKNRKEMLRTSTQPASGNIPTNIIVSMYLVEFRERDKKRYVVIPPLTKKSSDSKKYNFPIIEMNSAIRNGKRAVDKIAEELVFNRKLKTSFDALNATNYLDTGEFAGAVKQGLIYLTKNDLINKKQNKKVLDLLNELKL